jgi:hypothetical protein
MKLHERARGSFGTFHVLYAFYGLVRKLFELEQNILLLVAAVSRAHIRRQMLTGKR